MGKGKYNKMKKLIQDIIEGRPADDIEAAAYYDSAMKQLYDVVEHRKPEPAREHGDCAKLPKTVDLRFDICRNIEQVLKIGRDYQNKDGYRGAHYDTVKLLCDAIEYQQEQLETKTEVGDAAKLREALSDVCYAMFNFLKTQNGGYEEMANALDKAKAALAAPPRNCNKYPHDQALRIWSAEPENPMNGCFDVWLYAPATEKEGGVK